MPGLTAAPGPAAGRRSAAVAARWRDAAPYRRLSETFDATPVGPEVLARRAVRLFRDVDWLGALLTPLWAALADDPWFDPPLRVNRDATRSGAILFETPAVAIGVSTLAVDRSADRAVPPAVVFSGRLSVTRYLCAGGARLRSWAADPVPAVPTAPTMGRCRPLPIRALHDGMIVRQDGRVRAHAIADAAGDVTTLTAAIRVGAASVGREYDPATGRFLRMATNDEGAARAELMLSLLRASGTDRAGEGFAVATRDPAFFLRWAAMREWLAHDWRAALPRLGDMAQGDPHPEIRAAATTTLIALTRRAAA